MSMVSIRAELPVGLRAAVEHEAAESGLSISEVVRRRLTESFGKAVPVVPTVDAFGGWEPPRHLRLIHQQVWYALAERTADGYPCLGAKLVPVVDRHKANVHRALDRLCDEGYAVHVRGKGFLATHPDAKEKPLAS